MTKRTNAKPNNCQHCGGEGWHMARWDSIWYPETVEHDEVQRIYWNACMECNRDGDQYPTPEITYEEFLKRKRGEK